MSSCIPPLVSNNIGDMNTIAIDIYYSLMNSIERELFSSEKFQCDLHYSFMNSIERELFCSEMFQCDHHYSLMNGVGFFFLEYA